MIYLNIGNTETQFVTKEALSLFSPSKKSKSSNMMTDAIKAFADEYYTGLTDEEREAIQKEIKAYLNSLPKGAKPNADALRKYINELLKKYGFKGCFDDMANALMAEAQSDADKENAKEGVSHMAEVQTAYEKLGAYQMHCTPEKDDESSAPTTIQQPASLNSDSKADETITKIIKNPDGRRSIVTVKNDVILSSIKLDNPSDLLDFLSKTPAVEVKELCTQIAS